MPIIVPMVSSINFFVLIKSEKSLTWEQKQIGIRISLVKIGRFRSSTSTSTSTSFQLRNRSTHIERESPSELVLVAAVQYDFRCKSRTEQNEFGIDNISQNKCAIHKQLPR